MQAKKSENLSFCYINIVYQNAFTKFLTFKSNPIILTWNVFVLKVQQTNKEYKKQEPLDQKRHYCIVQL